MKAGAVVLSILSFSGRHFLLTCLPKKNNRVIKAIPFKIQKSSTQALLQQVDEGAYFYDQLHYHSEYQITAIEQGEGVFYAGNGMTTFQAGDVLFVGAEVPHLMKNAGLYFTDDSPQVLAYSLFFDDFSFGKTFFEIEESSNLKSALQDAMRVLKVEGDKQLFDSIKRSYSQEKEQLILNFIGILSHFTKVEKTYLNSESCQMRMDEKAGGRLNEVMDFTFSHFHRTISIEEVARIACLSRSQFSHFFKQHTGKSYVQFLNDWRIETACFDLRQTEKTIDQICFDVGFRNRSNFQRQFKRNKGLAPSAYRKRWQ